MSPRRVLFWLGVAVALVLGSWLRLDRLPAQILGDDEMHAIRAAMQQPLSAILVTYQDNDNCIPLTALFRARLDRGEELIEMDFRQLPVLTGVLALLIPLLWRRWIGDRVAVLWCLLLALSPLLIGYSRIVRSYMPMVALSLLAVSAAWRALHEEQPLPRAGWWALHVVLGALAAWFHLGAAPFVAAPLLFLAWDALKLKKTSPWVLVAVTVALAAGLAAFLVPARESFLLLMQTKSGRHFPTVSAFGETLLLQSGSRFLVGALVFWLVTLWGLRDVIRNVPRLGGFLLVLLLSQLVGLVALAPAGVKHPLILNRYLLVWTPLILLGAAWGIRGLSARVPWPGASIVVPVVALAGLFVLGPITDSGFRESSFQHHYTMARFSRARIAPPEETVPSFYYDLAREADGRPIYEFPWSYGWPVNHAVPAYQEIHRRPLYVVYRDGTYYHPQVRWANLKHFGNLGFLDTDARYLIIHKDLRNEELRVREEGFQPTRNMVRQWNRHRDSARIVSAMLRQDWGEPSYEDTDILVYDLDVVRVTNPDWKTLMRIPTGG